MNSLVQHLAVEEPTIATIAVGPGRVDTDMQKEIRNDGAAVMTPEDYAGFVSAFEQGKLNPPEKPAEVIAKLSVDLTLEHSGRYIRCVPVPSNLTLLTLAKQLECSRYGTVSLAGSEPIGEDVCSFFHRVSTMV